MKILYFADNYTWNIYGTKRSTAEALREAGHVVVISHTDTVRDLLQLIEFHGPDQVWLFHSDLRLPAGVKEKTAIPVIGFGISDPYYFSEERFQSYDIYVTYHYQTYLKYKDLLPCIYNATACDFKFHRKLALPKDIDVSIIGLGEHPRFHDRRMRITFTEKLREEIPPEIHAFGTGWPDHPHNHGFIDGVPFLEVINRSMLGLDIQDDWSPLAHRMFEYAACGVPVITRGRDEVFKYFQEDKEILAYETYDELRDKIRWYLKHPARLEEIGRNAQERCRNEHDIRFRVKKLLAALKSSTP